MEASALHAPTRLARLASSPSLLRLRSDEQLVWLLRRGSQDAFRAIYERYGQRLFAYVRQMLGPGSRQDAEDVLQDVFTRTYTMLRNDEREIHLRPWLYRVAHNRCIDHLRRPQPATTELVDVPGKALHDPFDDVQRREDLQRLVSDIERLPEQQKSALLLREINGLSYRELAEALDVSVSAVKSLLVRARLELVETAEARETACLSVREDLALAADERVRPSPRVRRHVRDCAACRDHQAGLRRMRRSFAALSPVAVMGPLAVIAKAAGLGGSGGGAGATAGAAGGGVAGSMASGGLAVGTAGKIAAVVSTVAITAGGAVEIERRASERAKVVPTTNPEAPAAAGRPSGASAPAGRRSTTPTSEATKGDSGSTPSNRSGRERDRATGDRTQGRRDRSGQGPAGTRRTGAPLVPGDRPADGSPDAERPSSAPGVGGGDDRNGGGGGGGVDNERVPDVDLPSRAGSPVRPELPVTAPEVPARKPDAPRTPAPKAPNAPGAASPGRVAPVPNREAPAVPPVKEKVKGKVETLPKPPKEVVPKPPKAAVPKPAPAPKPALEPKPAPKLKPPPVPQTDIGS